MDKRKIEKFKQGNQLLQGELSETMRANQVLNSTKVNEALLMNADAMFAQEFNLKQKAQLKYFEGKQKRAQSQQHGAIYNALSHDYLWSCTKTYYYVTAIFYICCKQYFRLTLTHSLPFLAIPPTLDYFKREYYVSSFREEQKQFHQSQSVVNQILSEKASTLSFEHVLRFVLNLSLDKPIEDPKRLLPKNMD